MTPVNGGDMGFSLPFLAVVIEVAAAEWGWLPEQTLRQPVARTMAMLDARLIRHGKALPQKPLGMEAILRRHGIGC